MYMCNIFINRMFKSCILGLSVVILLFLFPSLRAYAAVCTDTLPGADPTRDSILTYLNDYTFNRMLDQAARYQQRADYLRRLGIEWRKEAAWMDDPIQRGRLQKRIEEVEDSAEIYNALANEHFHYLSSAVPEKIVKKERENPYLILDTVLNGIRVYRYNLSQEFMERLAQIRGTEPEAIMQVVEAVPVAAAAGVETPQDQGTPVEQGAGDPGFRILEASPYGENKPFERDIAVPKGVFYRIQLAVYSQEVPYDRFGGLSPITTETIPGKDMTRYFVGKFERMQEAERALLKVRAMGYSDAFIVGYYDGRKTSLDKLESLEE